MRSGDQLRLITPYTTRARQMLEHLRVFKKGVLFLDKKYTKYYKGRQSVLFIQYIFYNIFKSTDSGFDFLTKFCDKMRHRAITKEITDDPIVNQCKNLEFCYQISVLKKALCKRDISIKIEEDLLKPVKYRYPSWVKKMIPQTFCKIEIQKDLRFSSTKGCILNSQSAGGSFAILKQDISELPIYREFTTKYHRELEINPTIWHILNNQPKLLKTLKARCFELTEHYHECNEPMNCNSWHLHPPCLITQIQFRGGKVRPLTMFLPEINFLASLMKNTFKKLLMLNYTTDLFVSSKYYYSEIVRTYKSGDWLHSGDLRSCTNRFDPRLTRDVLWDIWVYATGNNSPKYRRILVLAFSFYRLVEEDLRLRWIREKCDISEKRYWFNQWLMKQDFIKQMNGQHMGMSLSFWMMGAMHALTTQRIYRTPVPKISATDEWNLKTGRGVHPDKIDPDGNLYTTNQSKRNKPLRPGRVMSFGDDSLHNTPELINIQMYREHIEDFNQQWSTKGDFVTQEGCVFTERGFTRKGDRLVPFIHVKSKLLFPELGDTRPYGIMSIQSLNQTMNEEYDTKWLNKEGRDLHKYIDLAKKIMFEHWSKQVRKSHIPIHVPPKWGGLGMPGQWNRKDIKWMIGLYQISKSNEFSKNWKRFKKNLAPVITKPVLEYAKLTKVHAGPRMVHKASLRADLGRLTSVSENIINNRPMVARHLKFEDYRDAYNIIYNKMKFKLLDLDNYFSLNQLNYNLVDRRFVGIDDELDLALMFKQKRDTFMLSKNFRKTDLERIKMIINKYKFKETVLDVYQALVSVYDYSDKTIKSHLNKRGPEEPPFEYKSHHANFRKWEPYLPCYIKVTGLTDSGKRVFPSQLKDRSWTRVRFKEGDIFYKKTITPFDELGLRQKKFLQMLLVAQSLDVADRSILDDAINCEVLDLTPYIKYDDRLELIPQRRKLINNKYNIYYKNYYWFCCDKVKISLSEQIGNIFKYLSSKFCTTIIKDIDTSAGVRGTEYWLKSDYKEVITEQGLFNNKDPYIYDVVYEIFDTSDDDGKRLRRWLCNQDYDLGTRLSKIVKMFNYYNIKLFYFYKITRANKDRLMIYHAVIYLKLVRPPHNYVYVPIQAGEASYKNWNSLTGMDMQKRFNAEVRKYIAAHS
jgi:hypothetical protein